MTRIDVDEYARAARLRAVRRMVAVAIGGAGAVVVWRLLIPWDLSEIDARGRLIPGGGDDSGPVVALALIVLVVGSLPVVVLWPRRRP